MSIKCEEVWQLQEKGNVGLRGVRADKREPVGEYASGSVPAAPVAFQASESSKGSKIYDWIFTEWLHVHLLSAALVELLEKHALTGWSTYPVTLTDRDGERVGGYRGLAVTGRCGELEDGPRIENEPPMGRFWLHRGYYFDPASWDGSDIFMPAECSTVLLTDRARRVLAEQRIKSVTFERLTEIEHHVPTRLAAPAED